MEEVAVAVGMMIRSVVLALLVAMMVAIVTIAIVLVRTLPTMGCDEVGQNGC